MSLRGLGVDLCSVIRMAALVERHGERLRDRVFEAREWDEAGGRVESLAARWAAKEAVVKALGTGFRGVGWTDIAVHRDPAGPPRLVLTGAAAHFADERGGGRWHLSFSHESDMAVAVVVWET